MFNFKSFLQTKETHAVYRWKTGIEFLTLQIIT